MLWLLIVVLFVVCCFVVGGGCVYIYVVVNVCFIAIHCVVMSIVVVYFDVVVDGLCFVFTIVLCMMSLSLVGLLVLLLLIASWLCLFMLVCRVVDCVDVAMFTCYCWLCCYTIVVIVICCCVDVDSMCIVYDVAGVYGMCVIVCCCFHLLLLVLLLLVTIVLLLFVVLLVVNVLTSSRVCLMLIYVWCACFLLVVLLT